MAVQRSVSSRGKNARRSQCGKLPRRCRCLLKTGSAPNYEGGRVPHRSRNSPALPHETRTGDFESLRRRRSRESDLLRRRPKVPKETDTAQALHAAPDGRNRRNSRPRSRRRRRCQQTARSCYFSCDASFTTSRTSATPSRTRKRTSYPAKGMPYTLSGSV